MKFAGELKFPDIDHPGVPVQFLIEGTQAELIVEGESLGRWSLFDVRARRLIASAFEIDLDGTEVTFVAADPIDFAYRGVEHMAQTWASMKSKRIATRPISVRKSRRGTKPSRIEDMRAAMESNLESLGPQPIPGEPAMPSSDHLTAATETAEREEAHGADPISDWDQRDQAGAIPLVGRGEPDEGEQSEQPERMAPIKSNEELSLEAEKTALAEERARLEAERRAAEEREANLIEAYRLEVERLEAEREDMRRQAVEAAERSAADRAEAERAAREAAERSAAAEKARAEKEAAARAELEREAAEREERERQAREREAAVQAELERRVAEREATERKVAEREAREREAAELAAAERAQAESVAPVAVEAEDEGEEPRPAPSFDASAFRSGVVDLDDLEEGGKDEPKPPSSPPAAPDPTPEPEPALAGAPREKGGGGLMGAVKAAFRTGPRDHEHQFVEAPGGIGITRYVCEECGYVSISV